MSTAAVIGEVREYGDLIAVFRARTDALNVSRKELDDATKLPDGYCAKVLCVPPMKTLGPISFGTLLGALGLKLLVVEDPEAMRRYAEKMEARNKSQVRTSHRTYPIPKWLISPAKSKKLNALRSEKLSPEIRSKMARYAVKVRWKNKRAAARLKRLAEAERKADV